MTEFIDLQTQKRSQSIGDVFSKIGQLNSSPALRSAVVCMPGCRRRPVRCISRAHRFYICAYFGVKWDIHGSTVSHLKVQYLVVKTDAAILSFEKGKVLVCCNHSLTRSILVPAYFHPEHVFMTS
jgi:hypothetical protein